MIKKNKNNIIQIEEQHNIKSFYSENGYLSFKVKGCWSVCFRYLAWFCHINVYFLLFQTAMNL